MLKRTAYTQDYYAGNTSSSASSAREVLSFIFELWAPKSVVDFGCGVGTWLNVAGTLGASRLFGFDGPWAIDQQLDPAIKFTAVDLTLPVNLDERFDLAICVEVAEHLPTLAAPILVKTLSGASNVVLFSAAIPDQGGTGHINEQWPSYWTSMFSSEGFDCFDCIRPRMWNNERVSPWYKQNAFLFVRSDSQEIDRAALKALEVPILNLVHPDQYALKLAELREQGRITLKRIVRNLINATPPGRNFLRRRRESLLTDQYN
jgi:hypothetical protein